MLKDGVDRMLENKTVLITGGASGIGLASGPGSCTSG